MIRAREGRSNERRQAAFGFGPVNVGLLAAGLVAITTGYVLLGNGSTVAAPLLLVLGYVICIPAGLLLGLRGRRALDEGSKGE